MKIFWKILTVAAIVFLAGNRGYAQGADFKAGKALEVQYNILRELNAGFVDSVDIEKLTNTGINAPLGTYIL